MSQVNKNISRKKPAKKKLNPIYIVSGVLVVLVVAFFIINGLTGTGAKGGAKDTSTAAQTGSEIKITKSEITEKATFIPYESGKTKMEVIAVKAPDGTVRTALNTCQVCYDSGRGYYVQEGSQLVCQNCGNRFNISQIEKEKNGCNPVPIMEDSKTDDGQTITIAASVLDEYAPYFENWKR